MTKKCLSLVLALCLTFLTVAVAAATVSDPADTYVDSSSSTASQAAGDSADLWAASSGTGVCNPTRTTYLRWSLAGTGSAVDANAKLILNASYIVPGSSGVLALFRVTNDAWDEATLTPETAPEVGPLITSQPIPAGSGAVVFSGQNVADWIHENTSFQDGAGDTVVGDDLVSFAVQVSGCGVLGSVVFDSRESSSGPAPRLELSSPTAVTLSTLRAADSAPTWPLAVGSAFLVTFGAGGALLLGRRRTALH